MEFLWSIVLLILVALAALSLVLRTLRNGVAPMPSSARVQARMIGLATEAALSAGSLVVELGSGWGNVSLALSRAHPQASVIGYENSPVPFWFSTIVRCLFRARNLRFVRADFYHVALERADLVVCYLGPAAMARLQPKFARELKPAALVMSSTFAVPEWKPWFVEVADDIYKTPIYLYRAGSARSATPGRHVDISVSLSKKNAGES